MVSDEGHVGIDTRGESSRYRRGRSSFGDALDQLIGRLAQHLLIQLGL
jgi:hypothetical protein